MSLFNKILKGLKDELETTISKEITKKFSPNQDYVSVSAAPVSKVSAPERPIDIAGVKQKIKNSLDLINGISYECEVEASSINPSAHPAAKPISFMVSKDGKEVLAIAVVKRNTYKSMPVVGTKQLVEDKGIKYIRFFAEMENEPEYIKNRIEENL